MGNLLPRENNQSTTTPTELNNDGSGTEKEIMDEERYLSPESMMKMIDALAIEVIKAGEAESYLINNELLTNEQVTTVMKANTFLTVFATLLLRIVEREKPEFAKMILDIWIDSPVKNLVRLAFAEEIEAAVAHIADGINELEQLINRKDD